MNQPKKNDNMMPYEIVVKDNDIETAIKITDYINKRIKGRAKEEDNFTYFDRKYYKKIMEKNKRDLKNMKS